MRKPRPKVWPPLDAPAGDTFATPSPPAQEEDQPLIGPEPPVFGGLNPESEEDAAAVAESRPEGEEAQPLGTALEEAVRGNELLPEAPPIDFVRVFKSTPFLLVAMLASLIFITFVVRMAVQTESYVQTVVSFENYTRLNELELQDFQIELTKTLRTYPLRASAWALLQKRSPGVLAGFLDSGLTFHRFDAITWEPEGNLILRVDSDDPSTDITRLSAITEAFYEELARRAHKLGDYREQLKQQQALHADLVKQDVALKDRIDALLPDAQRYIDLKQNMQAMERYVELAEESNPLRLVARQNLMRITQQVSEARQLSLQRDDLLAERVNLQKSVDQAVAQVARLNRAIDVFVHPKPLDPQSLTIHDTRGRQKLIMRGSWIGVILLFGGITAMIHVIDHRRAERQRLERRQMLEQATKVQRISRTVAKTEE